MKKIILVAILLLCCFIKSQAQTSVKEDLEWVANTIQKNYSGEVYDIKSSRMIKAICKTDFDESKFLLYIYRYNREMSLIDEVCINFKETNSVKAIFSENYNETLIYFGIVWSDDGTKILLKSLYKNEYVSAWYLSLSNDGEDFRWKKMDEKLKNILKVAKGTN